MNIPLTQPHVPDGTLEKIREVLDSGYLTEGPVTEEFENAVAEYVGVPYALAVTSGMTGLELALRAMEVGPGDEVVVPDYTHPATASAVRLVGANLVLVDVDPETMLIDYEAAEAAITERTAVILPVSQFGNPLDWDRLDAIRDDHAVPILEDAACALGAEYRGEKVGSQADITVFSFHPRKFITTGEGGVVATANEDWAEWMWSYKHFGKGKAASRPGSQFERIGTNYKMSDILAAVGLSQMQRVEEMLARRIELAERYIDMLSDRPGFAFQRTTRHGQHSYQTFCGHVENRDEILNRLRPDGIEVQIGSYALHRHPAYEESAHCRHCGDLDGSTYAYEHCLALPLYHQMTEEEQRITVESLDFGV
jgi:dTDP-4-amino-4,6-dideoxygalactose transaminase